MNDDNINTLEQIQGFLAGTQDTLFRCQSASECYDWVESTLIKFGYRKLRKKDKGLLRRYMQKITSYSRSQVTRLITQHQNTGRVHQKQYSRSSFSTNYTDMDIALLAETDQLHNLSGPATKKLFDRAYSMFKQEKYKKLSAISISHIYNLRKSKPYLKKRHVFTKTKPAKSSIGERRKPNPNNQPGFIRIDTVHQGDQDKQKGVYHINAVDEVTQFEIVCTVEKISEAYLIPALEIMLESFPFKIENFHSDNGSEYVNYNVKKLLNKLLIEFTKSRARRSNDNALAEGKNAAIVRKTYGYSHIPQKYAEQINKFNVKHLNPYINYHRPCYFPKTIINKKGKEKKTYPYENIMTPYEKLKSLSNAEKYLKGNITFQDLDEIAYVVNDHEAAKLKQQACKELFGEIFK